MGQGYTRNDSANNIANGNVIDAADLDGEFDAIVDAFAAATGHTHDGTTAEGGAITVVGPAQEYIGSGLSFHPKTDDTYDLGAATQQWKDLYIDGTAYLDAIDLNGTAITATGTELNYMSGVTSAVQTQLDAKQALDADLTAIAALANTDGNFIVGTGTTWVAESGNTARTSLGLGTADTPTFAAATINGNITVTGTVDGRDVATDGTKLDGIEANATADQTAAEIKTAYESNLDTNAFTDADHSKLDGIEAGADVTDTTNVTAAGALMDSEVTNLAQVKAFSSADYATAAQGATADAALPTTGGAMTGPITTTSTFDGRDVATDGTKLDGIEALADVTDTTNVTAAGALMDSELTNITAVKALDQGVATTDSPTFADPSVTTLDVGTGAAANSNANDIEISKAVNNVGMSILANDDTGASRIYFGSQTNTQAAKIQHTESNSRLFVQAEGDLYFQTGGTNNRMTVNSSTGNVGIGLGTTAASTALEVSGTVTATAFSGDGSSLTGLAGQVYDIQEFTSSGTWTRPTDYLSTDEVWVWVVGGGGAGAGDATASQAVGGNGGVGVYIAWDMSSLGSTETVTVGAGGTGGTGAGADGGNSSFGTSGSYGYIRADGGEGGVQNDGTTGTQSIVMYDTLKSANTTINLTTSENPFYGKAVNDTNATSVPAINATIYGGGAGASNNNEGGFSMWGGNGGTARQNGGATGAGRFPGGGGGANDSDNGNAGNGGNGIVVVYTKRTAL